jgi:uncharacterized membrane protein YdjX (TVP38/TMEM64 family)
LERGRIIGGLWFLLGTVATLWTAYDFWRWVRDPEYGLSSGFHHASWWFAQALFPLFFLGAAIAGMGLLRRRRWAAALLRGLAPMVILYVAAYEVLGDPDWKWGTVALGCLVLAGFSLPVVYAGALRSSTTRLSK